MDVDEIFVRNLDRIVHHFEQLNGQTIRLLETAVNQMGEMLRTGDSKAHDHVTQVHQEMHKALLSADRLEHERVEALKDLVEARFEGSLEARRVLQDRMLKELERHTEEANERFERIEQALARALPQEVYDERHMRLQRQVDELMQWRANVMGRAIGLAIVGTLFVAVTTAFITHLIR